jgi:hypothetical protein
MAARKHMRLQIHGDYVNSNPIAPEVWALNIRLAMVMGGGIDDVADFPDAWDVNPEFATATEADWDTTTTWKAVQGGVFFEPMDYLTDQVMPAIQAWMPTSVHSAVARCLGASLYPCSAPTGNSIDHNVATATFHTPLAGGASGSPLPLENSVVLSWGTNKLGPRGRGRVYSPVPPVSILDSTGAVSDTPQTNYLNNAVDLLQGIALDRGTGLSALHVRPCVTGPSSTGGSGAYQSYAVIKTVSVGDIVDTQRRRRNKEPETRVSASTGF